MHFKRKFKPRKVDKNLVPASVSRFWHCKATLPGFLCKRRP